MNFSFVAQAEKLHDEAMELADVGRVDAAIPLAERALSMLESALGAEHPDVAGSLSSVAGLHRTRGDLDKAEPLYLRALTILENALGPESPVVATLLNNLALLYELKGDGDKAKPLVERAVAILEKASRPELPGGAGDPASALEEARQLDDMVARLYGERKYDEAIPLAERELALLESALGPEHTDVAQLLNGLAMLWYWKGDNPKAAALHQRALTLRERALGPHHPYVAQSLNSLAMLHEQKGDYARSEPLHERALAIVEKAFGPEHPDVATVLGDLARLHYLKGDYVRAEPLWQRALAIREKAWGPEHPDVAESLNNLAELYRTKGDHARAEPLYQRALALLENTLGPEHPLVAKSLSNLALLNVRKGDYDKAEPMYQRVIVLLENALGSQHPDDLANAHHNLAMLHYRKGDYAKAEPPLLRAIATLENTRGADHPRVATWRNNLAALFLAAGETTEAMRQMERAAAIQDRNAAVLLMTGSDEQKRAYMDTLRGCTHQVISLHVQFASDAQEATRLALTTILNRKGRVLDAMTDSFAALRRRLTVADQERLDRLRCVITEYSAFMWRGPGDTLHRDHRATLARLDEERQNLEADISRRAVERQGELLPVTIEQVQAEIPEGAVLVDMVCYRPFDPQTDLWGKPRYVAYVLHRQGEIAWVDLGEAEPIDWAVVELASTLGNPAAAPRPPAREFDVSSTPIADHRAPARELDRMLLQPIRRLLGPTRRILLSPDGLLNLVPFGALVDEEGRYLVERYQFNYLASGRDLLRLAKQAAWRQGPVVVAAPDYGKSTDAAGETGFQPLHFAEREGRALARKIPGATLLAGTTATKTAITRLAGPKLLHIATHGFFLPPPPDDVDAAVRGTTHPKSFIDNPLLRSGIALACANRRHGDQNDGILTALEVSQLDLMGTKLVVLSACETGVGTISSGDGVYGLRRALVMAGAETQVMSLWRVDDAATCELMEAYYEKLLAGVGRVEALRQSQIEMLERPDRAHPFYWASFIASGNDAPLDVTP
ncbi:CHAT domain-containing tetratricopeptide repeat protein [Polyangium spumosum]|nr:CHAT domain-containing protein [Polyangium spumosum]